MKHAESGENGRVHAGHNGDARHESGHRKDRDTGLGPHHHGHEDDHRATDEMRHGPTPATLSETFKILGDPTRLRIAFALSRDELCVCDLASVLGVSQSVVSHSLRSLRQMRLVRFRREGKIAYYVLDDEHIGGLLAQGFQHVEELR